MYEYFTGKITELTPTYVISDIGGVGYFINISLGTYAKLQLDTNPKLYVHQIVREDAHLLYGFVDKPEREIFRLLLSVSGVGANTARVILSSLEPGELKSAIETDNVNKLKSVKGIGLKTAQRIILDLKDKISKTDIDSTGETVIGAGHASDEALAALVMLGFPKKNAEKAILSVKKEIPEADIETLVKQALKRL